MRKEYPLHEERRIENGWDIDLIWCPSQIYKTFTVSQKEYRIYLRWRFDDPWEMYINHTIENTNYIEILVNEKEYQAEEYQELMDYIDNNIEEIIKKYEEIKSVNQN
jgi:hypothetical protein